MVSSVDYSRLNTYDGDQPYIFISYAHKDSETVVPIIQAMQEQGYRIWFDLGIEAGTEWSNNIAAHLQKCAAFLVFTSKNSVQSENCLDEIAFAKSHQKPSLMVFLEDDVTLPAGTEMQTARFQRMFRSRHQSQDTFLQKICEATILDSCRDGSTAPVTVSRPAVKPAGKLPLVIGLCAVLLIGAIIALVMAFSSTSAPGQSPTESQADEAPATEATIPEELVMSDDLMDYTFTLDGVVYQLPCLFSDFTDAGWTISSSDYSSDTPIDGEDYTSFRMSNNGRSIYVSVYNYSGNTRPLADCPIGHIECEIDDNVDFSVAKGLTPGATVDEVIAAFGTPNERSSGSDYTRLSYVDDTSDTNGVAFTCYSDESMRKYSSISMRNFVKLASDKTETVTEYPAYLNDYTPPAELGDDLLSGIVSIDGDLYQLPAPVSEFVDNGWQLVQQPGYVIAGGRDYVNMERDGLRISLSIQNFSDYQTLPENCAVHAVDVYDSDDVPIMLPGGITIGTSMEQLQAVITDDFDTYTGSDYISYSHWEYEERELDISLHVASDTNTVDWFSISLQTWIH